MADLKKLAAEQIVDCPECGSTQARSSVVCEECGHEWDGRERATKEVNRG